MTDALVIAEARRGELRPITAELVSAGREVTSATGGSLTVATVAESASSYADAGTLDGVDQLVAVQSPSDTFDPHLWQLAVERLIERESPRVVVVGNTIDGLGFGPAVAARMGLGLATDVTAIRWADGLRATRPDYGGKVEVELSFPDKDCTLLMIREGSHERAAEGGTATPETIDLGLDRDGSPSEHVDFVEPDSEGGDVDIGAARFLLAVGRGVDDRESLDRFEELAEKLGATLAVSRPLVDAGWAPSSRQVGQSGKVVSPNVYLAMGISGAVQHLAGIRDAKTVIAVNSDAEAPIFQVADYGAVADMFEVADELASRVDA